jgi:hypothetical protein
MASEAVKPLAQIVNPIKAWQAFGQSVWLDYLRRSLFTSGEFNRLITEDGLRGVTSNPSIFEKAIAGSTDYLNVLQEIEQRHDLEPMALYEALAIRDIREAADLLRPVYDATGRVDGYVSLEVSPDLAHDTAATIDDARRLWKAVRGELLNPYRFFGFRDLDTNGRVRDLAVLFLHLLATFARLAGPGGARSVVAESVVLKHQLLILNRSRKRSPNLRPSDRVVAGLCALFLRPGRMIRSAIVLNPRRC